MEAPLDNASVKKKPAEPVADRFSYPLVIGSAIIGVVAALFSFCIGLYVTYVCWTDLNGGKRMGAALNVNQVPPHPVAETCTLGGHLSVVNQIVISPRKPSKTWSSQILQRRKLFPILYLHYIKAVRISARNTLVLKNAVCRL
uniref:Transmembrane protein n=1 Tax=Toxoplasma gondii (strain ATCC 50861 / VEG) TaxID=432359 RepID=A0A0F7V8Z1_TOXGV|nr:TPA: hypothetical protein BN1205_066160 [Toxoplasma gondii VEG]